ncbi:ACP S-malonyltransferase [Streptomyces sp. TLI_171]|uniref:ACP S-malonyltransferase n=1 Tax=Streptomyces sp. TLI_171 TaxID=1938859 RepID=UPI000C174FA5|nr:ACP S-malonyltransferase [Streptomyces sp. TLI_171]RKE20779.1 [acyl-carrier-protein] S-malonyltransferase [Streptomyces sp. TLI_171]
MDQRADRIALMFPGQGAQRPGMGLPWLDSPHWRVVDAISQRVGRDVGALLIDADAETLRRTDNAQLATFTLEMVILQAVRLAVPELPVAACAGHSLGEYGALVAAGVLKIEDAAVVVAARGSAMADAARAVDGTMAVLIGGDIESAVRLTQGLRADGVQVWPANLNGPAQTVVSGTRDGIDVLTDRAGQEGFRVTRIPVGGAFHSPLMQSAQQRLAAALDGIALRSARVPVVANVDGQVHGGDPVEWQQLMVRQVVEPVQWDRTVRTLVGPACGATALVELGPGAVLGGLARRIVPGVPAAAVGTPEQVAALAERFTAAAV